MKASNINAYLSENKSRSQLQIIISFIDVCSIISYTGHKICRWRKKLQGVTFNNHDDKSGFPYTTREISLNPSDTFFFKATNSPHFLIESSSKLLRGSSRVPFVAAVRVNDDDLDSNPGWILWEEDMRLLLDTSRLDRPSLGSPEELGLLLEMRALFEVLPFREVRPLSESACWKVKCKTF